MTKREDPDLFDRSGRPTELALARLQAGELDERRAERLRAALDDEDAAELDALAAVSLAPSPAVLAAAAAAAEPSSQVVPLAPRSRRWGWVGGGAAGLAAAAAAVLWVVTPETGGPEQIEDPPADTGEGYRSKGARFDLQLRIDDGERNFRAGEGDVVHAGDKIAFEVAPRVDGHLVILCVDPAGAAARCHPLAGGFELVEARADTLLIAPGLAFDDAAGEERFIGLLCAAPVELDAVLRDPEQTPAGCERDEVRVRKAVER